MRPSIVVVTLVVALCAGALYWARSKFSSAWTGAGAGSSSGPSLAAPRVVAETGCTSTNVVELEVANATVAQPLPERIGRAQICPGNVVERVSGQIDRRDVSSSEQSPGDFNGKDRDALIAAPHTYSRSGKFSLFVRIRTQCYEHGQSARAIFCGSGAIVVQPEPY